VNVVLIIETFIAFVVAITFHECGHAGMAHLLGDPTPDSQGRLSLNPARHLAAMGTVVGGVLSFAPTYVGIGWGRPVRPDALRLRVGPNFGIVLVALAGPALNLFIGIALAAGLNLIPGYYRLTHVLSDVSNSVTGRCSLALSPHEIEQCLTYIQPAYVLRIEQFIIILAITNVVIAFINVLPLYPLDGYQVVFALLPNDQAVRWRRWEPQMEAIALILFFVVPFLLRSIRIPIEPASIFRGLADLVVSKIAGSGIDIAEFL
jgi:Zn-dependent protease